jgi:hypothetical protein
MKSLFNYKSGAKLTPIKWWIVRVICKVKMWTPIVLGTIVVSSIVTLVIYVAVHFIIKYW